MKKKKEFQRLQLKAQSESDRVSNRTEAEQFTNP